MTRIRWGILGTGLIARIFTTDLRDAGLDVAAVGSRSEESAHGFATEFGLARAHGSYEGLIADREVDVIYVATPNPFHAEHALLAIEGGKHVVIEKPFTLNGDEAALVVAAARSAGVAAMEAMWSRFLPHMTRLRQIVDSGALGDVRTVLADFGERHSTDPHHRINDVALGGGSLLDLGIYPISFAIDLLGPPLGVVAHATMGPTGVDKQTAIVLEHPGGRHSISHSAINARSPIRAAVIGTEARVEIEPPWYAASPLTAIAADGSVIDRWEFDVPGRGMQLQAFEFERVLRDGQLESPVLPLDESVAIMRVLDGIREQIGVRYPGERVR